MPHIVLRCQRCQAHNYLPASYRGFVGRYGCDQCNSVHSIRVVQGSMMEADLLAAPLIDADLAVPETVLSDILEADRAFQARCYRACVVMVRRAMERACLGAGASGRSLHAMLEDLNAKAVLGRKELYQGQALRLWGNHGAHPQDDGLDDVTSQQAKLVLETAAALLPAICIDTKT